MYKYMNLFRCCVTVDSFTNYIKLYPFISHCIYSAPHWIRSWMNWKSSGQCRSKNSSDHRCTQESCRCSALSSLQLDRKQPKIKSKEKIREIKIQEDFRKDKWKSIRIARIAPFWLCLRSLLPVMSVMLTKNWQGQLLAAEQLQEMHFHLGKFPKKISDSQLLCVCVFALVLWFFRPSDLSVELNSLACLANPAQCDTMRPQAWRNTST